MSICISDQPTVFSSSVGAGTVHGSLSGDEFCTNSARGCRFCTEMHVSYSLHVVLCVSVQMYSSWKIDLRSVLYVPVRVQMYSSWKIDLRSALRRH